MESKKKERKKSATLIDIDNRLVIARGGEWIGGREIGEEGQKVKRKNSMLYIGEYNIVSIFPISK